MPTTSTAAVLLLYPENKPNNSQWQRLKSRSFIVCVVRWRGLPQLFPCLYLGKYGGSRPPCLDNFFPFAADDCIASASGDRWPVLLHWQCNQIDSGLHCMALQMQPRESLLRCSLECTLNTLNTDKLFLVYFLPKSQASPKLLIRFNEILSNQLKSA